MAVEMMEVKQWLQEHAGDQDARGEPENAQRLLKAVAYMIALEEQHDRVHQAAGKRGGLDQGVEVDSLTFILQALEQAEQRVGMLGEQNTRQTTMLRERDETLKAVAEYFTVLDTARRVKARAGSMGVDVHLQDLQETEAAARAAVAGPSRNPVDAIEEVAEGIAAELGVDVDRESFEAARAYVNEPVLPMPASPPCIRCGGPTELYGEFHTVEWSCKNEAGCGSYVLASDRIGAKGTKATS